MNQYDRWSRAGMPSGDEAERIQRDIARTMGDVIRHDMRNVHRRVSPIPDTAEPRAAPKGNGWRDPAPLSLPPGQDLIERMVNAALPPGPGHRRKPDDEPPKAA